MPNENIDSEQAKINALESRADKQDQAKDLKQKLAENHDTFNSSVDAVQKDLSQAEASLQDSASIQQLDGLSGELAQYLAKTAAEGEKIYWDQIGGKPAKGLETIDAAAKIVNDKIKEIRDSIPLLKSLEYAEYQCLKVAQPWLDKAKKIKETGEIDPALLEGYKGKKEAVIGMTEFALTALVSAKRGLKGVNLSSIPSDLTDAFSATLTMVDDSMGEAEKLKQFYETMDYISKEKNKKYFNYNEKNGEVSVTDEFKKLPQEQQDDLLMELKAVNQKVKDEVDEKCAITEEEKRFFNGKKQLAAGEWIFAKQDFVAYAHYMEGNANKLPEDEVRLAECKQSLKEIALMEVNITRQRLNLIRQNVDSNFTSVTGFGTADYDTTPQLAQAFVDQMESVLQKAEKEIESGNFLTIDEVNQQLHEMKVGAGSIAVFQSGFFGSSGFTGEKSQHLIFDVLGTQCEINKETDPKKREEKILALAAQARKMGFTSLARHYYDMYFEKELQEKSSTVNREDIAKKVVEDEDTQKKVSENLEQIKTQFIDEYQKKNGKAPSEKDITTMLDLERSRLVNMLVEDAYTKAVKLEIHSQYKLDSTNQLAVDNAQPGTLQYRLKIWNELYGNTFRDLDTLDKKWYQVWRFSDEEWNRFRVTIWLDVATMAATMGTSGVIVDEVMANMLAKSLVSKGITTATVREVIAKGMLPIDFAKFLVKELGIKKAAAVGVGYILMNKVASRPVKTLLGSIANSGNELYSQASGLLKRWGEHVLNAAHVDAHQQGREMSAKEVTQLIDGDVVYKI